MVRHSAQRKDCGCHRRRAEPRRERASNRGHADIAVERDARRPLRGKMGAGWDVANAALFLASDEANFITGVALRLDRGALVKVGSDYKARTER